jgi:hypothetical protein
MYLIFKIFCDPILGTEIYVLKITPFLGNVWLLFFFFFLHEDFKMSISKGALTLLNDTNENNYQGNII